MQAVKKTNSPYPEFVDTYTMFSMGVKSPKEVPDSSRATASAEEVTETNHGATASAEEVPETSHGATASVEEAPETSQGATASVEVVPETSHSATASVEEVPDTSFRTVESPDTIESSGNKHDILTSTFWKDIAHQLNR